MVSGDHFHTIRLVENSFATVSSHSVRVSKDRMWVVVI